VNWWITPDETRASIADSVNATLFTIFGALPSRISPSGVRTYMNYNNVIIGTIAILALSFGSLIGLGAGILLSGISTTFISGMLYGTSVVGTMFPYAGIFLMFIGILVYLAGRSSG
jgi:hypothetical protein